MAGEKAAADPEPKDWEIPSPPPTENFTVTPVVTEGTHQHAYGQSQEVGLRDAHAEHFPGPIHQPPLVANVDAIQPGVHHEHPVHPKLQHHFDDMEQQVEASALGMWVFLVTEIMFFGGLFMAYIVYRAAAPEAFQEASHHLSIGWGAFNTAVLIFSSLTMALAVRAAQTGLPARTQVTWLLAPCSSAPSSSA